MFFISLVCFNYSIGEEGYSIELKQKRTGTMTLTKTCKTTFHRFSILVNCQCLITLQHLFQFISLTQRPCSVNNFTEMTHGIYSHSPTVFAVFLIVGYCLFRTIEHTTVYRHKLNPLEPLVCSSPKFGMAPIKIRLPELSLWLTAQNELKQECICL